MTRPFTPFGAWASKEEAEEAARNIRWSVMVVKVCGGWGLLRVS